MNLELKSTTLAYIAGVVDGEGCIGISRYRKNYHYNYQYLQYVNVVNTNTDLLQYLKQTTQIGVVKPRKVSGNRTPAYWWCLRNPEMPDFLETILPFLRVKKRQAEIMLEFLSLVRYVGPSHPQSVEEVERKCDLFYEIEALNQRGL